MPRSTLVSCTLTGGLVGRVGRVGRVGLVGLVGAFSACSAGESGGVAPDPAATVTPTVAETPSSAPTELSFGDTESVTWEPASDLSGVLSIRVDAAREGRFSDFAGLEASGITKHNQPYYVDVVIANESDADLGGLDVPLYLADSNQTLTPPSRFADDFGPCASGPLPTSFGSGAETRTCLVFLGSPGADLEAITFQPALDTPAVSWTGDVEAPAKAASTAREPKQKRR